MNSIEFINLCLDNNMPIFCGINVYYDVKSINVSVDRANINLKAFRTGRGAADIRRITKIIMHLPDPPYLVLWYHEGTICPSTVHVNLKGLDRTFAHLLHLNAAPIVTPVEKSLKTLVGDRLVPAIINSADRYFLFVREKFPEFDTEGELQAKFNNNMRNAFRSFLI